MRGTSRKLLCILIFVISFNLYGQTNYKKSFKDWRGRKEWNNKNYKEAESHFRDNTIDNPNVGQFHFNRGTALYKNENFEEAQSEFQIALNDRKFSDRDQAYHNLGNIAFHMEEYEQALELFRKSLIENSDNKNSRINYELTKQILQQNQQESQSQNENNESEENEQQQQQEQQGKNEQEEQEKSEAERLLQALEQMQEQERDRETQAPGERRGRFW